MAYAQSNYAHTLQGIDGQYSIAEIGCFVTAFCNLEEQFGHAISPPDLNNYFSEHGTYIDVDDGIRDDLGWSSIGQYDSQTQVSQTVDHGRNQTAGWPASNDAIVRFYYRSVNHPTLANGQPNMIFHFCKVADWENHLIVDSWDGSIKHTPYGEPTAWAVYSHTAPVSVNPSPSEPPFTVEVIDPKQVITNKEPTTMWGMNYDNLEAMIAHPIKTVPKGTVLTVTEILDHKVGYTYYREPGATDAWNTLDCIDYVPPKPRPLPQGGLPIPVARTYDLVANVNYYGNPKNSLHRLEPLGQLKAGKYYIFGTDGNQFNLSSDNQKDLQHWVNPIENVVPKEEPKPEPAPFTPHLPDVDKATFTSFKPNREPVRFKMEFGYNFTDLNGYRDKAVHRNTYEDVDLVGTFLHQGHEWGRVYLPLRDEAGKPIVMDGIHQLNDKIWYAVPMINPLSHTQYVISDDELHRTNLTPVEQIIYHPDSPTTKLIKAGLWVDAASSNIVKRIDGIFRQKHK